MGETLTFDQGGERSAASRVLSATMLSTGAHTAAATRRYAPHARAERLIAVARFVLACSSLFAVYLEPSTPAKYQQATYALLGIYSIYAAILIPIAWFSPLPSQRLRLTSHIADVILFSIFVYLTEGPASPFFLYFVFSLFCATLRFTWKGILLTGLAAMMIYGAMATAATVTKLPFEISEVAIREAYLAVISAMLAYVGVHQERLRSELASLAAWPRTLPSDLDETLAMTLRHCSSVLHASRVLLVWEEGDEPWLRVASFSGGVSRFERLGPSVVEPIEASEGDPAMTFFSTLESETTLFYDAASSSVSTRAGRMFGPRFRARFQVDSAIAVGFRSEAVSGHLLVLGVRSATADDLALAHIVGRLLHATLEQFFYVQEVGQRASTEERLRIARDLHDGIVQSLGGVGLQLQSLGKRLPSTRGAAEQIAHLQRVLEDDQRDLRELVRELRTHDIPDPQRFLDNELSRMRERFALEWGLNVSVKTATGASMPSVLVHDLCRIVNECLSNAARHGAATQAEVTLSAEASIIRLQIRDNGHGFPFQGRMNLEDLTRTGVAPRTLRERIVNLRGDLTIESNGGGAMIDASIPFENAGHSR